MVEASFNIFDMIVIATIGLSALLSFFRGFVREFFSLGTWIGASIITLYAFPHVVKWLTPYIENGEENALVISGIAGVGTFMTTLILLSIITSMLMKLMKSGADIGLLDNFLGLCFGALRGTLLVTIGYIVCGIVMPKDGYDHYIATAMTKPYIEKSAAFLMSIAPDYIDEISSVSEDGSIDPEKLPEKPIDGSGTSDQWDSMDKLQQMIDEKANEPR